MSSVIVADQLTKWYGPRLAVDRVSLEVRAGEVLGLLGPNGSGKTTILRILTGYLRPSSGTVSVAGLDIILDAPGNGLDPRQIIELRELIRSLAGPFTVLVTSHILGEIERVADRAAILLAGRLLAIHPLRGSDAGRRLRVEVRGDPDRVRGCLGQVEIGRAHV